MAPANQSDHKGTLKYLPMHHRTKGLTKHKVETFKALENRYVHEGRTIDPSFLEGTNIRQIFKAINFDSLLDIDEPICPRFVLEFYASVKLITNDSGEISLNFSTNETRHDVDLKDLAIIFNVPNHGVCLYTDKWPLSALDSVDSYFPFNALQLGITPLVDKDIIREHLFERTTTTRVNRGGVEVEKDPYGMELSELRPNFRKWENILRANVICTIGNRDHINASLSYMLYSLSTGQPFNLSYYLAKRMANIPLVGTTALPYGMLLTRLFRAVSPIPPNSRGISLSYDLIPHTFVPISAKRVYKNKGKRTRSPTPPSSSSEMSEDDSLPNSKLDPFEYLNQLPTLPNESEEFKQTKGMWKCMARYLRKINKKMDKLS